MKKLLTFILLLVSLTSNAKVSETKQVIDTITKGVSTVYSDVKSVTPELKKALGTLSNQLGVATGHVWEIIVKQQRVNSITYLCVFLISCMSWFSLIRIVIKESTYDEKIDKALSEYTITMSTEEKKTYEYEIAKEFKKQGITIETDAGIIKYVIFILASIGSITSIWNFNTMITGFLNPEYGAMQHIAELVLTLSK